MANRLLDLESSFRGTSRNRQAAAQPPDSTRPAQEPAGGQPVKYAAPGLVPPLAQPSSTNSWGTVFTMLSSWKKQQSISTESALGELGQKWADAYKGNSGLAASDKVDFVAATGLVAEPPKSFSVDEWHNLIRTFGPLWVTGQETPDKPWATQAWVITGIGGDGTAEGTFFNLIDPNGAREYREKISDFVTTVNTALEQSGSAGMQVFHWPSDARTSASQAFYGANVIPMNAKSPVVADKVAGAPAIPAATTPVPPSDLNRTIQELVAQGANEAEIRSFLTEIGANVEAAGAESAQASLAGAFADEITVTLPGGTVLDGYKAVAFRAALSTSVRAAPGGAAFAMIIDALPAIADRFNVTIGVGPAISGGIVVGRGFGVGVMFAPGGKIGFYGSMSGILGAIVSISATVQVTVVKGGPENFRGQAVLAGVAIDVAEGPTLAAHAILSTDGRFLGVTGEAGLTLGLSPFEAFAQYQHTAATLSLSQQAAAGVREFDVKLRIFIPAPAVDGPGINPMGGDGRSFDYSAGTHRAVIHAKVHAGTSASHSPAVTIVDRGWGASSEYRQSDVTAVSGRPGWYKNLRGAPAPIRRATLPTTSSNLTVGARSVSLGGGVPAVKIKLHAAGALPLLPMTPNIDADLDVFLSHRGRWNYMIRGSHDGFPAYELYIDRRRVYSHDPIARRQTPLSLLPPSEFSVSTPWHAI